MKNWLYSLSFLVLINSCAESKNSEKESIKNVTSSLKGFELMTPSQTGVDFLNEIIENEDVNHLTWDALFYGGGVAAGDINNDGLTDLFFTGNQVPDALYLNKGDFKFEDISISSGISQENVWSNGVSMVDVDGDGFLDIYVCRSSWRMDNEKSEQRKNCLFINNGDNTFSEKAEELGIANTAYSTQSAWFDYDGDSDLDLFLLNAPSNNLQQKVEYSKNEFPRKFEDKLYRNDGGAFIDVTKESNVGGLAFGLGVVTVDVNHDGLPDIYVANDYEKPDYYYQNNGDGTFSNRLDQTFKHTSNTAMGVDAGDMDNDALQDLIVLDMQSESHFRSKTNMPTMSAETFFSYVSQGYNYQYMTNVLQKNNGTGFFSDVAQIAGVASTDWSWSVLFADFDQDSYQDIYITNGINRDIRNNDFSQEFDKKLKNGEAINLFELSQKTPSTKIPNYLFQNNGDLTFSNKTEAWGAINPSFSYGAAYADLDNDGDLDLVVNNNNDHPFIYKNSGTNGNWLKARVKGKAKNTFGVNTKIITFINGESQYRELALSRGYQSSVEPKLHFGLGDAKIIDSLLVLFPDGKSIKKYNVKANQELNLNYNAAKTQSYKVYDIPPAKLRRLSGSQEVAFVHIEDNYDDWENEVLLPHRESRNGPFIDSGDLDGDGRFDLIVSGAANQATGVLLQKENGMFENVSGAWVADKAREDLQVKTFDLNNDGKLEFYVSHGGNHLEPNSQEYRDVIYSLDSKVLELEETVNSSCVAIGDVDKDGYPEIFVGANNTPEKYPQSDGNVFYSNNKGILDLKSLENLIPKGIVKDAEFTDLNGDGYPELIVVGHWMSPTILWNENGEFTRSEPMGDASGWWYSVTPGDVNGDGLIDFVCGNIGYNNKYHPSAEKPLKLYQGDFDSNNTNDIVLAKPFDGKYVPVRGRECSSEQLPYIKENFEDYESFASASIEQVLGDENIGEAEFYEVNEFRSGIFVNRGGSFEFVPFSNEVQIGPVMDCVLHDFNGDKKMDLILAGNHFDAEVETTRHDSGNGLLLLNEGDLSFEIRSGLKSGFFAQGNVKSLEKVKVGNSYFVLVGNNNSKIGTYLIK